MTGQREEGDETASVDRPERAAVAAGADSAAGLGVGRLRALHTRVLSGKLIGKPWIYSYL